ncbi:hypothetical protein [Nocardia sp. NPDC052566]|uniref:hypothetical protein n=1 Tax=Nocardia sp. NPDC052566 TaxID=3364330 RepID=UPI0037CA86B4
MAIVGTLSGAVVGAGATLLTDSIRARREKSQRFSDTQRQIYVKYLTAVVQTDTAVQALALRGPTPLSREDATAAFRSHALVAALHELELVASKAVREDGQAVYGKLRDIREALTTATMVVGRSPAGSAEWHAVHQPFLDALERLRNTMRRDLNPGENTTDDTPSGS